MKLLKRSLIIPFSVLTFALLSIMVMAKCSSSVQNDTLQEAETENSEIVENLSVVEPEVEVEEKIIKKAVELTDSEFYNVIQTGVVLVDFWAAWCAPCRIQAPILDDLANEIGEKAKITKLNVDHYNAVSLAYNVRNIPTILIFKDGVQVKRYVGVQQKDFLMQELNKLL